MLDKSPACGWADAYRASRRRYIPQHYFVPWTRAPLHAWCASRPSQPSRHLPGLASKAANTARYASLGQRCGWRKTTRVPRQRRSNRSWTAQFPSTGGPGCLKACVLEAIARGAFGGPAAAGHALERALDLAEPNGMVMAFLLQPAPAWSVMPAAHRPRRPGRRHPQPAGRPGSRPTAEPRPLLEALSCSETRVLRYLPAKLPGAQRAPAPGHPTSSKACINGGYCAPRIGQYAHLQQCIRPTIRTLIIDPAGWPESLW